MPPPSVHGRKDAKEATNLRRFVSGPTIAALTLKPRMTVNNHLRAGHYGRRYRVGCIVFVDLAEVERAGRVKFSEHQLEVASAGLPDRILIVREPKEVA